MNTINSTNMKTLHTDVWYADENRAKSPKKLLVYSDIGNLQFSQNAIIFKGKNQSLEISNVSRILVKNQTLNWVTYLIGGVACLLIDLILGSGINDLLNTNWALTKLYLFLAPICIVLFWLPMRWVVVEYTEDGAEKKAYFSSGEQNGWASLFGANKKLKQKMMDLTSTPATR